MPVETPDPRRRIRVKRGDLRGAIDPHGCRRHGRHQRFVDVDDVHVREYVSEVAPNARVEANGRPRTVRRYNGCRPKEDLPFRTLGPRSDDHRFVACFPKPPGESNDLVLYAPRPPEIVRGDQSNSHSSRSSTPLSDGQFAWNRCQSVGRSRMMSSNAYAIAWVANRIRSDRLPPSGIGSSVRM